MTTKLLSLLSRDRREFLLLILAHAVLAGSEAVLHPLMLKWLFDEAIVVRDFTRFLGLSLTYLLIGLTIVTLAYFVALWKKSFENKTLIHLETRLLERTLDSDWRDLAADGAGSYLSRIHKDALEGFTPMIGNVIQVVRSFVAAIGFIGVLFYLSWQASLILIIVMPTLLFVSRRLGRRVVETTGVERQAEARYITVLTQTLEAFRAVRGLPRIRPETVEVNRQTLTGYLDSAFVNFKLITQQKTWSDVFMNLSDTASMVVGAYFVFLGQLSFGGFLAFTNALWRAVNSVFTVIKLLPELQRNEAILNRLLPLYMQETPPYHTHSDDVQVSNVEVHLDGRQAITLARFRALQGKRTLIRGANGAGKSTLLHVIAGYLAPDAGTVTRPERVAALTAPVHLPPLRVATLVPDERLQVALGIEDLAHRTADTLSSGQRQKVGIGSVLSETAPVYLLDEPFANLDDHGKLAVLRVMFEYTKGRTLIMVHHGDQYLDQHFDQVVVVQSPGSAQRQEVPVGQS